MNTTANGEFAVNGTLTMTVPALKRVGDLLEIPTFYAKKTGGLPVCNSEWDHNLPLPLVQYTQQRGSAPWKQDLDINFSVAQKKDLYLISEKDNEKLFFKIQALGQEALKIHCSYVAGDKVVIFGKLAVLSRTNILLVNKIFKVME